MKTPKNMMTSSNGNIFRVTGTLYEEFTRHRGRWVVGGCVSEWVDVLIRK